MAHELIFDDVRTCVRARARAATTVVHTRPETLRDARGVTPILGGKKVATESSQTSHLGRLYRLERTGQK